MVLFLSDRLHSNTTWMKAMPAFTSERFNLTNFLRYERGLVSVLTWRIDKCTNFRANEVLCFLRSLIVHLNVFAVLHLNCRLNLNYNCNELTESRITSIITYLYYLQLYTQHSLIPLVIQYTYATLTSVTLFR